MRESRLLFEILEVCVDGIENSKDGLETYTEDSLADHGDGQQVGREAAYRNVGKVCCAKLMEVL